MPYKSNGKYTYKGRKYRKHLSTRRIFGDTSNKAQAKQIAALRKSVSRVFKYCRPEVKELAQSTFSNKLLGQYFSSAGSPPTVSDSIQTIPMPTLGTGDNQRVGNVIRLLPIKFRMALQYREVYGTAEGSTIWNIPELPSHGMQVRVVAIQAKSALGEIPTIRDILENYPVSSDYLDTMSNMVQQFKNGITGRFHILYNKVYNISRDKPTISKNLVIKPVIKTIQWEDGQTYPKGQVFLYFFQGGAVSRMIVGDPKNFYDYNGTEIMYKFTVPYTDA